MFDFGQLHQTTYYEQQDKRQHQCPCGKNDGNPLITHIGDEVVVDSCGNDLVASADDQWTTNISHGSEKDHEGGHKDMG